MRDGATPRYGSAEIGGRHVSRLSDANVSIAKEIIGRYPRPKSALIPLLHLAQEQDGHLTNDAMAHIAELIGHTPAEVLGTATFYEMFKFEPVGKYLVNICGTMSCMLIGADELMHHAEERLGIKAGRHDRRRADHARARRVPGRLHRGAVPAGQLPLPVPRDERRPRRAPRRPAVRRPRRRDPAARHARHGAPAHPGRPRRRPARPRRRVDPAAVDPPTRPRRELGMTVVSIEHGERSELGAAQRVGAWRTPIARAPGFIAGDRPTIVTSRFARDDSHTLDGFLATGGFEGLRAALGEGAAGGPRRGAQRHRARPRRRRLPGRRQVGAHPAGRVAALPRRQRRRERAGHVQGPPADGARPAPAHRGLPHRVLRGRACRSASCTSAARWPSPRSASPRR